MIVEGSLFNKLELILTGFIALPLIGIYLVLTFPIYIYRWVVAHLVAPFYRPEIGNIISGLGLPLTLEFYQKKKVDQSAPYQFKSNLVVKFAMEGTVPFGEVLQAFQERVINKLSTNDGSLFYPELQQYPALWMGFMFWKKDSEFNVNDHFHYHTIDKTGDPKLNSQRYVSGMMEQLVNRQFQYKRSPWEMHVVHNYKTDELPLKCEEDMTMLLFCVHHSIADGYSLVNLLLKDFGNTPPSNFKYVAPSSKLKSEAVSSPHLKIHPILDVMSTAFRVSSQILSDLGYVLWIRRFLERTPWHANPVQKRKQNLMVARSKLIPTLVVKGVKNKFGVTFTSVLLSIVSKGISENFKKSEGTKSDKFTVLVVQPLPNHPRELRNHATAVYVGLSSNTECPPSERLQLVDASLKKQRSYLMRPIIANSLLEMFSLQLASIANLFIGKNPTFATSFSNFPIPAVDFTFNGRKIVDVDCNCGTLQGVSGVAFLLTSYEGNIRLGATAESEVMSREELDELIHVITNELYALYQESP